MDIIELENEYKKLSALIRLGGGELDEEIETALEAAEQALIQKADACHWVLKKFENDSKLFKEEAARLSSYAKTLGNSIDSIKSRIIEALENSETKEIEGENVLFKLKNNPPSLKIVDADLIPATYKKEVTETVIDNAAIKADLKNGPVEGAVLTVGKSLMIGRPKK